MQSDEDAVDSWVINGLPFDAEFQEALSRFNHLIYEIYDDDDKPQDESSKGSLEAGIRNRSPECWIPHVNTAEETYHPLLTDMYNPFYDQK